MKRLLLLVLLLSLSASAQVARTGTFFSAAASSGTPTAGSGVLQYAYACVNLSATAPTLATGWTSMGTGSINGTSTADSACLLACRVTTSVNQITNAFTNATTLMVESYSGFATATTATCNTAASGTPSFFTSTVNTTSTVETFNAITSSNTSSWVAGAGYAPAATAGIGTAPTGMTNAGVSGTIGGLHDTNTTAASFVSANVTLTTAGRIVTATWEIKAQLPGIVDVVTHFDAISGTVAATTAGHAACIVATGNPASATITAAAVGTNTLTQVTGARSTDATGNNFVDIWCKNNAVAAQTAASVTCSGCTGTHIYVHDISNQDTVTLTENPGTVINGATCTSCTGPNATNTTQGDLLIVGIATGGTISASSGTGWVSDGGGAFGEWEAHRVTLTSGVNMNTVTFTGTGSTYNMSGIAIRPAPYAVQAVSNQNTGTGAATLVATLPSTSTAGNLLVAFVAQGTNNTDSMLVTDSAGDSFTNIVYDNYSTTNRAGMFYMANAGASTTVTVTFNTVGGVGNSAIVVYEVSGAAIASVTDGSAVAHDALGTNSSLASGALTTTNANDFILYGIYTPTSTSAWIAGTGYAFATGATKARVNMDYDGVSSTQSAMTTTTSWTTASKSIGIIAAFQQATAIASVKHCTIAVLGAGPC